MTRSSPNPSTTTCATRSRRTRPFVFAALAVSRWIERQTGWFIRKFIETTHRYHTIQIQAGPQTITAAGPCPPTSGQPSTRFTVGQLRTNLSH